MAGDVKDWDASRISDDTYRTKFIDLPRIIQDWIGEHGGFIGKEVLDFGCGEATTALGIALQYDPGRVVGIDIISNIKKCAPYAEAQLGLERLPKNLQLLQVRPGHLHS